MRKTLTGLALILAAAGCKEQPVQEKSIPEPPAPRYVLKMCVQNESEIEWWFQKELRNGGTASVIYIDEDKDMDLDIVYGTTGLGGVFSHYSEETHPDMQLTIFPGIPEEHKKFFKENCIKD